MSNPKLIRITTVPISLEKLLVGQLEFMQQHFEVTAISADKVKLEELGKTHQYQTHHLEMTRQITPWQDLKAVFKLYQFLKKERPMLVHTHTPKAGIVGMLAAKLAGVPIRLHTVAGLPLMEASGVKRSVLNFVEKITYASASKVYPNSNGLANFILQEKLATKRKIKVIGEGSSNGINTALFNPALFTSIQKEQLKQELNILSSTFVFVFVGRLVSDKGINELVSAFKKLQANEPNFNSQILLVGPLETELDPLLPETLQEINNNPKILSVGYQNDVRPYFAISDALVFPSYREGFPNVVMQAGAMGLPSIVSNINGCNEIIQEEFNGLIVPAKDSQALSLAMLRMKNEDNLRNKLQSNARNSIVARFEQSKVWEALLAEYQTLIAKNKDI